MKFIKKIPTWIAIFSVKKPKHIIITPDLISSYFETIMYGDLEFIDNVTFAGYQDARQRVIKECVAKLDDFRVVTITWSLTLIFLRGKSKLAIELLIPALDRLVRLIDDVNISDAAVKLIEANILNTMDDVEDQEQLRGYIRILGSLCTKNASEKLLEFLPDVSKYNDELVWSMILKNGQETGVEQLTSIARNWLNGELNIIDFDIKVLRAMGASIHHAALEFLADFIKAGMHMRGEMVNKTAAAAKSYIQVLLKTNGRDELLRLLEEYNEIMFVLVEQFGAFDSKYELHHLLAEFIKSQYELLATNQSNATEHQVDLLFLSLQQLDRYYSSSDQVKTLFARMSNEPDEQILEKFRGFAKQVTNRLRLNCD